MKSKGNTIHVKATYGRKFPAGEPYSTDYVEMSAEAYVEAGDAVTYADAAAKCFADVKASVDREVDRIKTGRENPVGYTRHPDDVDYITVPAENVELLERQFGHRT